MSDSITGAGLDDWQKARLAYTDAELYRLIVARHLVGGDAGCKGAISIRFSKRTETVKTVANQIVATERAFELLNVSEQIAARSLADELKSISTHLAGAARFGAMTAHRAGYEQTPENNFIRLHAWRIEKGYPDPFTTDNWRPHAG